MSLSPAYLLLYLLLPLGTVAKDEVIMHLKAGLFTSSGSHQPLRQVVVHGNTKLVLESLKTNCDHDMVEYFDRVPGSELIYRFKVVKMATRFFISIRIRVLKTKRIMYKIENLDGCQFLNTPLMNKIFSEFYRNLLVNNTAFHCPIRTGEHFLHNLATANLLPTIHPLGHFQLTVTVTKQPYNATSLIMQMIWNYSVTNIK